MARSKMGQSDKWVSKVARASAFALSVSVLASGLSATGCRITDDDVTAWARKASGPRKLVAVIQHDKYDMDLRVNAAMTLVTMPSRGGRAVGLLGGDDYIGLLDALNEMSAEERAHIVDGMVTNLQEGIDFVPQGDEADTSISYKDGAYALLTQKEGKLVTNAESKAALLSSLTGWCQNNFVARMSDTTQLYGMEQVLRLVRAPGVKGLTPLIAADFKNIRELARLIDELGDDATKLDASKRMVKVAKHIDSDAWVKQKAPAVEAANKTSGLTVKKKQFEKQLEAYQQEELMRVFGAMKSIGQKPIVDYLLGYAADSKNPEKRRAAALAGLEGNLDRKNDEHAKAMLGYLGDDDTPDLIRDVAGRRVGELSREQVAEPLYKLFSHERWQLRATVASLLLKMSKSSDMEEFMDRLGKAKYMSLSEPLLYGPLLKDLKGADPVDLADKYAKASHPAPVRLTALGYYYGLGDKTQMSKLETYKSDPQKVPTCHPKAEQCAWSCTIAGKKGPEAKEITTVGQFVEYCVLPAMDAREPEKPSTDKAKSDAAAKPTPKKDEK